MVLLHSFETTDCRTPEGVPHGTFLSTPSLGKQILCPGPGLLLSPQLSLLPLPGAKVLLVGLWGSTSLWLQLLGHQPLPQVSMSPGYSKDPWLPSHLPLKTDACRLQHLYQLTRYLWSPWGRNSAEPPCMSWESLHHLLLGPRLHH